MSNSLLSRRWRIAAAAAALGAWAQFALPSCAAPQRPAAATCNLPQSVHLRVDASDRLNLDDRGRSLPTIVRIYQLKNISRLEGAEFNDIWQRATDTLGEDLLDAVEVTVYPRGHIARSFVRNPEAMYVAAVAIVRHPAGISWRSVYELGPSPNAQRCAAQQRDPTASPNPPPDPRFFFFVEDYRIEGRDEPPEPPRNSNVRDGGGGPQLPNAPGGAPQAPQGPQAPQSPNAAPPSGLPGGSTWLRTAEPASRFALARPRCAIGVLCPGASASAATVRRPRAEAET